MYQMSIDHEFSTRTMIVLLKKVSIGRYMINDVRLCAMKTKNDLNNPNI